MSYYEKYLKYKRKYINLKKNGGGLLGSDSAGESKSDSGNEWKKVTVKLLISKEGFKIISEKLSKDTKIGEKIHKGKKQITGDIRYFGGKKASASAEPSGTLHITLFSGFIHSTMIPRFEFFIKNFAFQTITKLKSENKSFNDFILSENKIALTNKNKFIAVNYVSPNAKEFSKRIENVFQYTLTYSNVTLDGTVYTIGYGNYSDKKKIFFFFEKGLYIDTNHVSLNKKDASVELSKLTPSQVDELGELAPRTIGLINPKLENSLEFSYQTFRSENKTLLDRLEKALNKK